MEITAKMVKELRERTGAGMLDCKKALEEMGTIDKAIDYLREKGIAKAAKKAGRTAAQGLIFTLEAADAKTAVVLEFNSETDFVAKNPEFVEFGNALVAIVLEKGLSTIEELNSKFGKPSETIEKYELLSPYTNQTQNINNVLDLKYVKIRFYTEPDIDWWKINRENDLEDLNAFQIRNFYKELNNNGFFNIELIETKEKGVRANGTKHPHSWSIVDKSNLINWMLK